MTNTHTSSFSGSYKTLFIRSDRLYLEKWQQTQIACRFSFWIGTEKCCKLFSWRRIIEKHCEFYPWANNTHRSCDSYAYLSIHTLICDCSSNVSAAKRSAESGTANKMFRWLSNLCKKDKLPQIVSALYEPLCVHLIRIECTFQVLFALYANETVYKFHTIYWNFTINVNWNCIFTYSQNPPFSEAKLTLPAMQFTRNDFILKWIQFLYLTQWCRRACCAALHTVHLTEQWKKISCMSSTHIIRIECGDFPARFSSCVKISTIFLWTSYHTHKPTEFIHFSLK